MRRAALLLTFTLGACATSQAGDPDGADGALLDSGGRHLAQAGVLQEGANLRVGLHAMAMAPGRYGVHLHAVGRCDPPGFDSAGPHWNPTRREHGRDNSRGQHLGDLPNLEVGANGMGEISFPIPNARLHGGANPLLDADGFAIIIHAAPDDYRTDPSGNSGARIACGVLR